MSRLGRLRSLEPLPASPPAGAALWSAPLGHWGGVPVRVHVTLAVVVVLAIGACVHTGSSAWRLGLVIYLVSLALHEAAHVAAAAAARRRPTRLPEEDTVVLGPIGGLRVVGASIDPRDHVFVAMAGPVANLAVVVAATCGLAGAGDPKLGALLVDPLSAFAGGKAGATPVATLAPLLIAVNWPLFLLNLAPSAPFDGGVALRSWLSLGLGGRRGRDAGCTIALLVAAGLLGAGVALVAADAASPLVCAGFAALATVIAFGARADASARDAGRPPIDPAGLSLTDPPPRRHHPEPAGDDADASHDDEAYRELWDDGRVDAILAKVHDRGLSELTANERAILQRASRFYQQRRTER